MTFRVVLDTNVLISAERSESPTSPSREILQSWLNGEFTFLYTLDTLTEYARKLRELGIDTVRIQQLLTDIAFLGEGVTISFFHERFLPDDPDDIAFLLCATNGNGTHLVTYDSDFDPIREHYEFTVCLPLEFLRELRDNSAP